jgi:hypothetical protein
MLQLYQYTYTLMLRAGFEPAVDESKTTHVTVEETIVLVYFYQLPLERWDCWFEPYSCMDIYCVRLFCVFVVLCVDRGLATGSSSIQGVLPTMYRIKKLKKRPRSNKGL